MRHFCLVPCLLATLLAHTLAAAESRELYVKAGTNPAALEQQLAPLKAAEPDIEWLVVEVPPQADTAEQAEAIARAMEAGVATLPSLALCDEGGAYATLPLGGLTAEQVGEAKALATEAERERKAARRRFDAQCYLLCARAARPGLDDAALAAAIEQCRALLTDGQATPADRQFLGLRCLYPLLMTQYVRAYDGAHSPYTEAKLLEAIAALEAARDIDRETKLGKAAFAERERLRMARRKSRQYE